MGTTTANLNRPTRIRKAIGLPLAFKMQQGYCPARHSWVMVRRATFFTVDRAADMAGYQKGRPWSMRVRAQRLAACRTDERASSSGAVRILRTFPGSVFSTRGLHRRLINRILTIAKARGIFRIE